MKKIWLFILLLLVPSVVMADGGLVYMPQHYAREADQKAIITYHDGTENLILSINFESDSDDFGWIVPVPSRPEVSEIRGDIFERVSEMVRKPVMSYDYEKTPISSFGGSSDTGSYVEVLETKIVGDLITKVVDTNDSQFFYEWLQENNYEFPAGREDILDHYINNDWYFILSKVVPGREKSGDTQPIKITFETDKIVFPMKMTQISLAALEEKGTWYPGWQNNSIALDLFVFADEPMVDSIKTSDYNARYSEVEAAGKVDRWPVAWLVGEWLGFGPHIYLTKLSADLEMYMMDDDWYFSRYTGGDEAEVSSNWLTIMFWKSGDYFAEPGMSGLFFRWFIGGFFLIMMWLVLVWLLRRLERVKSKITMVVLWLLLWLVWSYVWYRLLFFVNFLYLDDRYISIADWAKLPGLLMIFLLIYPQIKLFFWLGRTMMKHDIKQVIKEVQSENKEDK
ncbi:MAG: DUF2330 domain-containing protein [Patescibacteria group bacterium]